VRGSRSQLHGVHRHFSSWRSQHRSSCAAVVDTWPRPRFHSPPLARQPSCKRNLDCSNNRRIFSRHRGFGHPKGIRGHRTRAVPDRDHRRGAVPSSHQHLDHARGSGALSTALGGGGRGARQPMDGVKVVELAARTFPPIARAVPAHSVPQFDESASRARARGAPLKAGLHLGGLDQLDRARSLLVRGTRWTSR
jgi:hypothetical protein